MEMEMDLEEKRSGAVDGSISYGKRTKPFSATAPYQTYGWLFCLFLSITLLPGMAHNCLLRLQSGLNRGTVVAKGGSGSSEAPTRLSPMQPLSNAKQIGGLHRIDSDSRQRFQAAFQRLGGQITSVCQKEVGGEGRSVKASN